MPGKIKGTVKWFSQRRGFGFITPTSDNSPTTENIFVHQSNIVTEHEWRSLQDGADVEFETIIDETGKLRAQNVTGPDDAPCAAPGPRYRRYRKSEHEDESADDETGGKMDVE